MIRVVLYARCSSDNQRAAPIEDQFRICREYVERQGWTTAACYHDAAISGASMILRPGVRALLTDARCGKFDLVLAGGEISELRVGLKGTMNALFLMDLAAKTHRGLRGRVEAGKAGGGLCYGYDVVKRLDASGEPVRGERTINPDQAEVIRRVFRDFAAGISPRAIARRLNDDGVPGPDRALWTDSTLRSHAKRGTGFLNNELHIGSWYGTASATSRTPAPASGSPASIRGKNGSSLRFPSFASLTTSTPVRLPASPRHCVAPRSATRPPTPSGA